MYPRLGQAKLLQGFEEALEEAWDWELKRCRAEEGDEPHQELKLGPEGWVMVAGNDPIQDIKFCSQQEIIRMVDFVVRNGYMKRGGKIFQQVTGFGMGLAHAPQLANLVCYTVEARYADT